MPPFFEAPNRVVEYLPYLDNRYIAAAASLTGGNSLAAFVKMVQLWADALEIRIPRSKIWERILTLGQAEQKSRRVSGGSAVSSIPSGAQSPIQGQSKPTTSGIPFITLLNLVSNSFIVRRKINFTNDGVAHKQM